MDLIDGMPNTDFIFGFSCNFKLHNMAEPTKLRLRSLGGGANARRGAECWRQFDEFSYQRRHSLVR